MTLQDRIDALVMLGNRLTTDNPQLNAAIQQAYINNRWFTIANCQKAVNNIVSAFLQKDKLENWAKAYDIKTEEPKSIGLVMAGNIPLVGFHDFLCVFVSGHKAIIKLSEKDTTLMMFVFETLLDINPDFKNYLEITHRLTGFDGVIATGSNNTARYFETYFGKYPNIIRKNRTSVAVLSGKETKEELIAFGKDIFEYFGLGCRNVSKVYIPRGYDFQLLMEALHTYKELVYHNKYKNNYDYSYTLLTMNKIPTVFGTCLLLSENKSLHARISQMHYGYYDNEMELVTEFSSHQSDIQCIVSKNDIKGVSTIRFGETQVPTLADYADGVDTMNFLINL